MELAKHPKYAEKKIFGKPPTSLKITTETGQELDWTELLTYMSDHDVKDTSVRYILFTTGDSSLKVEYYHPKRLPSLSNKNTFSPYFSGKYIFKKDASTPEEIKEFNNEDSIDFKLKWDPRKQTYIDKIAHIAYQNDIKLGLREKGMEVRSGIFITAPYIPKSSTTIQFSTTPITNPLNGKTTNVPVAIIPKGTYLYRGVTLGYWNYGPPACFLVTPEYYDKLPVVFFTLDPNIAVGYARDSTTGCIEIFTPKEDIQLIDFWTKEVLEEFIDINLFDNSKSTKISGETILSESVTGTQKWYVENFFGINKKSKVDFLNGNDSVSKYTKYFKDGTFQTDSSGKNTGFLYKGLVWGPNEGQYKRESIVETDFYALQQLLTQFPAETHGFYGDIVPNGSGEYFHSEVIIPSSVLKTKFEVVGRKQLGSFVGSKRKQTKKRRTYKKKAKKTKKQTIRYL
jgi:hypothetical protein